MLSYLFKFSNSKNNNLSVCFCSTSTTAFHEQLLLIYRIYTYMAKIGKHFLLSSTDVSIPIGVLTNQ